MIRNERQLKVAQSKRDTALKAAEALPDIDQKSYRDFADDLQQEIDEYCGIHDGFITSFAVQSLDGLGDALIKARIARRLTQKALAREVSVSEQMVQRDESGAYEKASLARLAEILDVLGYEFYGSVVPKAEAESEHQFAATVSVKSSTPSTPPPWYSAAVVGWPLAQSLPAGQMLRMFLRTSPVEGLLDEPMRYEIPAPLHFELNVASDHSTTSPPR